MQNIISFQWFFWKLEWQLSCQALRLRGEPLLLHACNTVGNIARETESSLEGSGSNKRIRLGDGLPSIRAMAEPMQPMDDFEEAKGDLLMQPIADESQPMDEGAQSASSRAPLFKLDAWAPQPHRISNTEEFADVNRAMYHI